MKTNLLSIVLILAVSFGYSQSKFTEFVGPNKYLSVKEKRMHPGQTNMNQAGIIGEKMLDFTAIGTTWYDLQTLNYGNIMKRMWAYSDGTIGSTWCGAGELLVYERGAGYNYFDGSAWGEPNLHVGPEDRMGSPCYAPWGENGEIIALYRFITGEDGSIFFYKREVKGEGDWEEVELTAPTGVSLVWHSMLTSGENHEHIHLLAETWVDAETNNRLLYYRSSDGAETWDIAEHIIEGLGPDYIADINDLSYDWANPVGDTIAFSYGFDVFGGRVFRSYDNGDSWEIIPVFNSPISGTEPPDDSGWIPCGIGSSACALDSDGNVHVAFSRNAYQFVGGPTTLNNFRPYTDGVIYWNESMEPLDTTTISTYTLDYLEAGGYLVGWVLGYENYEIPAEQPTYGNSACAFPQFSIDADDNLYLVYNSIAPGYDNGTWTYRHIIVNRSFDGGASWVGQVDINTDPLFLIYECAFPAMPPVIMDDLHITFQKDLEPGIAQWQEDHIEVENEITHMQFDKYIFTSVPESKAAFSFEMSECYPNPASDKITFNVNIENNTSVSYSITNITGQVVSEFAEVELKEGNNPVSINVSSLLSGIYFCTIDNGSQRLTRKFVVN